jgi:hypothetical protein
MRGFLLLAHDSAERSLSFCPPLNQHFFRPIWSDRSFFFFFFFFPAFPCGTKFNFADRVDG